MQRLRAWGAAVRALSWRDRWLLVQAFLLLPFFAVLLRLVAFRRVHGVCAAALRRREAGERRPGDELSRAREVGRIVAMASRHAALPGTCLHRSLALWVLLEREGCASEVKIGARKVDGTFTAHAWVECRGVVINDDPAATREYARLPWVAAGTRS